MQEPSAPQILAYKLSHALKYTNVVGFGPSLSHRAKHWTSERDTYSDEQVHSDFFF